jgi:tetratricopeptide (TPR) repeat protein
MMAKQKLLVMFVLTGVQVAWSGEWEQRVAVANYHLRGGRLAQAEAIYRAAETTATAEQRGIVLSNLGAIAFARAQFGEAERLWRRALEHGVPSDETAVTWSNLGAALAGQGRTAEADEAYARALTLVPADSAKAGNILNNRAELYRRVGRLAAAEEAARTALSIAEKHAADQIAIASRAHTLATILAERGQLQEALDLLRRARALKIAGGMREHPDMAPTATATAQILLFTGEHTEAEELANEALAILRRTHGGQHPRTAVALDLLASIYDATGRMAEADPLYREALAICDATLGRNHADSARIRVDFAAHLRAVGRHQAAIAVYSQALEAIESTFGAGNPRAAAVRAAMAQTYRAMGRPTEAARSERIPTALSFR